MRWKLGAGRRLDLPHLLLVVVAVVVDAAVEAVSRRHPLLLHQALEAMLGPTMGVAHHLHQAGHHAAHVPVFCLWRKAMMVTATAAEEKEMHVREILSLLHKH